MQSNSSYTYIRFSIYTRINFNILPNPAAALATKTDIPIAVRYWILSYTKPEKIIIYENVTLLNF